MATGDRVIHKAVVGAVGEAVDKVCVKRALLSVSDKRGLSELGSVLVSGGVELLSTGGTAQALRGYGLPVKDVSDFTNSQEILNGRVKTLHPKIHGGILAVRGNKDHEADLAREGVELIDLVVVNLYPFQLATAQPGCSFADCVENIDIGGPAMLRAAAKNFPSVVVLTSPSQYEDFINHCKAVNSTSKSIMTDLSFRERCAAQAFSLSAQYDTAVAQYFMQHTANSSLATTARSLRLYEPKLTLKYGCNPNQAPAAMCAVSTTVEQTSRWPLSVVNGQPGYINLLDALNAWQLVREVDMTLGYPCAASFKHVSPAGAAISAVPLSVSEALAYEVEPDKAPALQGLSLAYVRARQADPKSSFGDFVALSRVVDVPTAQLLKGDISDGVIAPGYEPQALELLQKKKGGTFVVLEMDKTYWPPGGALEYREVFGLGLMQRRNDAGCELSELNSAQVSSEVKRDVVLGNIALKFTQSNSVAFVKNGQLIGVGAGQQSRVDCVKLAGKKAQVWWLRQHPTVLKLSFEAGTKKQDRVNKRVSIVEQVLECEDGALFSMQVAKDFLRQQNQDTVLVSDAFLPFRDNIDVCAALSFKVCCVCETGGSVNDDSVRQACEEHGMRLLLTGQRLFHH